MTNFDNPELTPAGEIAQNPGPTDFLAGGGELGSLMRSHEWDTTDLGVPAEWPRSLKTAVRIMLTSRQPIWIGWGERLLYLYNDAYKSIIGGKHPWALGQPTSSVWREIWHDIQPLLDSAMSGDGTFVESQLLIMERNGYPEETYYTFSYSPIPGDDGRPAGIICANSDETRRVIGERQLALLREMAASSANARTVSQAIHGCLAAMATNTRDLLFASVFLRSQAGEPLKLAGGLDSNLDIDPHSDPWHAEDVMASGQPRIAQLPPGPAWPKGHWGRPAVKALVLPVSASGEAGQHGVLVVGLNPYRLPEGHYLDFLQLVARQVSAAIGTARAYERERQRAEELAELDRAKTLFFSNVSHEFRTPLTLMLGPLGDLLASDDLSAGQRERLVLMENNARRLAKLVNTLLQFSRIEAGRHEAQLKSVDLSRLTTDIASVFRSAMEKAGLDYVVECEPLPAQVRVDPDQWEQVVLNLLSNALKFTLSGRVALTLRQDGDFACLEVADTGVGVPEEEVGRLFDRFHRVQGTHGRTHEGSGIGLALVKELVRLQGGSITATSTLGAGTTFTVRLPLDSALTYPCELADQARADQAPLRQAQTYVQEALRWLPQERRLTSDEPVEPGAALLGERYRSTLRARVLVADDNADMRQYIVHLLEPYFDVEAVGDGEKALESARHLPPALVLSDVMMPRLDGFQLLQSMRQDDDLRSVPVILLSARAGEEARIEGLSAGADDYLVKPFSSRELVLRVAGAIELDRVRRSGEEQLKIFLAKANMFTWDIDLTTRKVSLSENAASVLGARPQDLAGAFAAVHPEDEERHRLLVERTIEAQGQYSDEIRIMRADDGELRWIEVRGRVVHDAGGRPVRLSGISFDITERKLMEQSLREQDKRKDEFLAMLAHELRNPMAPIRNAVELVNLLQPADGRVRRAMSILDRQVKQLGRLVDDLLDVSRITQGRIELALAPVDLSTVLSAAVEAAEPAIREHQHTLCVRTGLPIVVTGDAARLQQCLVNLLSNATKYTDSGGRIDIELLQDGAEAVVRVIDTGAGISEDLLPHVFELFVQSERTLDRSSGGLGIGLSVVKRLIEMHAGTVVARSGGVGCGATFEIRLPIANAEPVAAGASGCVSSARCKVLVVDDNEDAAESMLMALEAKGHEVRAVHRPEPALDLATQWQPDVILLDIGLPGMDGFEVARRLRSDARLKRCRLVALTGYGQPSDQKRSADVGFDHHLIKPAPIEEVVRLVRPLEEDATQSRT